MNGSKIMKIKRIVEPYNNTRTIVEDGVVFVDTLKLDTVRKALIEAGYQAQVVHTQSEEDFWASERGEEYDAFFTSKGVKCYGHVIAVNVAA